jgi:hypothetical protein
VEASPEWRHGEQENNAEVIGGILVVMKCRKQCKAFKFIE